MENNHNEENHDPTASFLRDRVNHDDDDDDDDDQDEDKREGDDVDADPDADADDEDSQDADPQQQTSKDGGVMIPQDLYATLPRAFQIGWEALSGSQQQAIIMASHRIRANNEAEEEEDEDAAHDAQRRPRVAAEEDEEKDYDITARALLKKEGFDPEDVSKKMEGRHGLTPIQYFCSRGNLRMCQYLVFRRGADGRTTAENGYFPLYVAAAYGQLEIVQFLCHECGAHEDIRKHNRDGISPLRRALQRGHVDVAKWLIRNDALSSPRDDNAGGDIDDEIMRRDLDPRDWDWVDDHRSALLSWAQDAVTAHDNIQLFLTSTNIFPEDVSDYVAGTQQQVRILRQLTEVLPRFINAVPFVEEVLDEQEDMLRQLMDLGRDYQRFLEATH